MPAGPPPIIIKSYISKTLIKVQLLLKPFFIIAHGNLAINIDDWHGKLSRLAQHLIPRRFVFANVDIAILYFVFVEQLLDFNAPGSSSGGINFNRLCHYSSFHCSGKSPHTTLIRIERLSSLTADSLVQGLISKVPYASPYHVI